ncbi:hypothetical protein [Marinicrinis sediminis]|uniref:Regulator of chromosome condensation (RCC1) repeat protein n=1 Tax=Marinicrinis sediminis TaxID=1652465 RepID=A0ABW5R5N8_9BACL
MRIWVLLFVAVMMMVAGCEGQGDEKRTPVVKGTIDHRDGDDREDEGMGEEEGQPVQSSFQFTFCEEDHSATQGGMFKEQEGNRPQLAPPMPADMLEGIRQISARKWADMAGYGFEFGTSYALDKDGSVYVWGMRGDQEPVKNFADKVAGLPKVKALDGEFALDDEDQLWYLNEGEPFPITGFDEVKSFTQALHDQVYVLKQNGSLYEWKPAYGEDGEPVFTDPRLMRSNTGLSRVEAGYFRLYGLKQNQEIVVISYDRYAEHPVPDYQTLYQAQDVQELQAGLSDEVLIIQDEGDWLILNSLSGKVDKVALDVLVNLYAHSDFLVAVKADGTVWASSSHHALTGEHHPQPSERARDDSHEGEESREPAFAQLPGLEHIVELALGTDHALALDQQGHVWSWGSNQYGQLGTHIQHAEPFVSLGQFPGEAHMFATSDSFHLLSAGKVWQLDEKGLFQPTSLPAEIDQIVSHEAYLTKEGQFMLASPACKMLQGTGRISQAIDLYQHWLLALEDGNMVAVDKSNANLVQPFDPIEMTTDREWAGAWREATSHVIPLLLHPDGHVYAPQAQDANTWHFEALPGLDQVEQITDFKGAFYDGAGPIARARTSDQQVYEIYMEQGADSDPQTGSNEPTVEQEEARTYAYKVKKLAEDVQWITGYLLVAGDGQAEIVRPFTRTTKQLDLPPHSRLETLYSMYAYPIEGPGTSYYMLKDSSDTLWIYGQIPFHKWREVPSQVRRVESF